jgi:hypothetical protein
MTPELKKSLSKVFGYSHTPVKNNIKHIMLDEYSKKQSEVTQQTQQKKAFIEKAPTKKTTKKKYSDDTEHEQLISDSEDSIPTAPIIDTKKTTKSTSKTAGRPPKASSKSAIKPSKKQKIPLSVEAEVEYPTDSDDDYGLTVFHNAHEKHRPHILTKQPYNMSPDELQDYQTTNSSKPKINTQVIHTNPFDQPIFKNMNGMQGFTQNSNMNEADAMKAMEVFKNFPGMQNMMNMNFDSDDEECIPFKSNGKGTYTSTVVHPDGHTTTTTTRTFVNGEEMDLADIPGLDPDFLAGYPELEKIPGLHGLFGVGKKKVIK